MKLVILTSDKYHPALRICLHQLHKHWPEHPPATVAGFRRPDFALPVGVSFVSIGAAKEYPARKWSDALIEVLQFLQYDDQILLLLEDYWLARRVHNDTILLCAEYMQLRPDALRLDLTTDRLNSSPPPFDIGPYHWLDLVQSRGDSAYRFSLQAGIWNRKMLLRYLIPGETPWELELNGTHRLNGNDPIVPVLGTRQAPLRYVIGVNKGVYSLEGAWQVPPMKFTKEDLDELDRLDLIPPELFRESSG